MNGGIPDLTQLDSLLDVLPRTRWEENRSRYLSDIFDVYVNPSLETLYIPQNYDRISEYIAKFSDFSQRPYTLDNGFSVVQSDSRAGFIDSLLYRIAILTDIRKNGLINEEDYLVYLYILDSAMYAADQWLDGPVSEIDLHDVAEALVKQGCIERSGGLNI